MEDELWSAVGPQEFHYSSPVLTALMLRLIWLLHLGRVDDVLVEEYSCISVVELFDISNIGQCLDVIFLFQMNITEVHSTNAVQLLQPHHS